MSAPPDLNIGSTASDILDIASDGDIIMKISPEDEDNGRLLRVSSQALKTTSSYFAALLSERWSSSSRRTFTVKRPMVVDEQYDVSFFLFMLIIHQQSLKHGDTIAAIKLKHLTGLAILVDKYMFTGSIPEFIKDAMNQYLARGPQSDDWESMDSPEILCISYFLNLPDLFAKASHQMIWSLGQGDLHCCASPALVPILPVSIFQEAEKEGKRLRSHLLTKLPPVFYPDPHGGDSDDDELDKWWCQKCAAFPHEERWNVEVVTKNEEWKWEQRHGLTFSLGGLFASYLSDMAKLDYGGQLDPDSPRLACGKFKVRFVDVNTDEMLFDLYNAIGGVCIHCFRAGRFQYETHCAEHDLDLA